MIEGIDPLWGMLADRTEPPIPKDLPIQFQDGVYQIPFLNGVCTVDPQTRRVAVSLGEAADQSDDALALAVLSYLVHIDSVSLDGEWVSEKSLPGGSVFFQGPHALPLSPISRTFGEDAEQFAIIARQAGGTPAEYGDASATLEVFPGVPICIVLWEADDEFPANATAMFDRSIARIFALDVILAVVGSVVDVLVIG